MFNLFKRHNKNYNPIITTTPPTDLKNIKGVNTLVIAEGCSDDACAEPSKRLIGWGMFSDGVAWKNRKDFIKTTANGFKSVIGVSQKIESIVVGEYSISEDIKGKLEEKKTGFSDLTTIKGKIEKLVTKAQGTYQNTYVYKSANATN